MSPVDPALRQTLADNVWLHFFQMGHLSSTSARPTILVRGEGSRVWDQDGNAYIDALAGLFCVNAGYGRREIVEAVAGRRVDTLMTLEAAGGEQFARGLLPRLFQAATASVFYRAPYRAGRRCLRSIHGPRHDRARGGLARPSAVRM